MTEFKYKTYAYAKINIATEVADADAVRAYEASETLGLTDTKQPDLMYMEDVLVSVGANLNDDVFLPEELLKSVVERGSVKLKPVNWEHSETDIIGVMYDSFIVDKHGNKIENDTIAEMLKEFDVVSRSVIWKMIHPHKALEIAQGAMDGSLFVSMEAFFNDYDYAVGNQIIKRNSSTSFLDYALRANGGTGEFDGQRVLRVLRDVTFGGKGIVAKPANPESFILSVAEKKEQEEIFEGKAIPASAVLGTIKTDNFITQSTDSGDVSESEAGGDMQEKINALEKELEQVRKERDRLIVQLNEVNATEKLEELEKQNTTYKRRVEELEKALEEKLKEDEKQDKTKADEEPKDDEPKVDMDARKTELLNIINLEGDNLDNELKKIESLSDDEFSSHLSYIQTIITSVPTPEPVAEEPKVEEPKVEEPKAEEPKVEEPKVEEPKAEEPKVEEPKAEEPKQPEQVEIKVVVEAPKPEEPKAEEPKVEEPKAEEPKAEEPKTEEPKAEEPVVEEPKAEEPKAEEPKAEEPKDVDITQVLDNIDDDGGSVNTDSKTERQSMYDGFREHLQSRK